MKSGSFTTVGEALFAAAAVGEGLCEALADAAGELLSATVDLSSFPLSSSSAEPIPPMTANASRPRHPQPSAFCFLFLPPEAG
nr:hypothetical protein [Streptomyces sabulosicollis]